MVFSRFEQFWLAEYQRMHDQDDLPRQLQAFDVGELESDQNDQQQLLTRAVKIAERRGVSSQLAAWQRSRRLLTVIAAFIAVVLGIVASQTVLAQPQPLSLLFALVLLLLPNLAMLLLWLLVTLRANEPHGITAIGLHVMQWLNGKAGASHGSPGERQQLGQAWLQHVQQQRLLAPLMAIASHGFWLLISLSSWLTLLLYLSFNDYQFHWATTILQQPQLAAIAQSLNFLPDLILGITVPMPGESDSAGNFANLAGRWLAACVLIYAVVPRALLVLASLIWYQLRLQRMHLDCAASGHIAVLQAIHKQNHRPQVVDADQGTTHETVVMNYADTGEGRISASLDYEANARWLEQPPDHYFGVLDSHAQKKAFLAALAKQARRQVELRIAANLTPDRSSLRFLAQIAPFTMQLSVQLIALEGDTYLTQWQRLLNQHGVPYVTL
ncbi:DUF2868 domain-containing protein [Pseudidiomarina halophila]|uniref:DUF2868 domain-containing protein n=1 Tax=Pseudidiomarina halophila TaxID=1449799 RepID=A0A432Y0M7_9GAMM|nr:DUF2868 domain-containing protein [Pseudidiomarina halophila]RUO54510.1 hypothetical protein CWI69_03635 [Pseudidiomarina halophila]